MDRKKVKVSLSFQMAVATKECFRTTKFTVTAHTSGPTERPTLVNGAWEKCQATVFYPGQTVKGTKAVFSMTRKKARANSFGQMDALLSASGKMESNMV